MRIEQELPGGVRAVFRYHPDRVEGEVVEPPSTTPRAISDPIRRPLWDRSVIGWLLLGSGIETGTSLAAPFYPIGAAGTIAWVTLSVGGKKIVSIPGEGEVEAWVVQTTDGRLTS